jgi:hypothetical protein
MLLGLNSPHIASAVPANNVLSDGPDGRRSIREEYGTVGGYGDDHAEADLFISVETKPMKPYQINPSFRRG